MKLISLLTENTFNGKTLVSCDIQPEYQKGFTFDIEEYTQFINDNYEPFHNIIFLFNGPDLGFPSKEEYQYWMVENGLNEDILYNCKWYDKGYAFFRYCIDSDIEQELTVNLVRFMYQNQINDSRDMDKNKWKMFLRKEKHVNKQALYDLLAFSGDCVNIPDLMDYLKMFNNIILTGGGVNECLKEVEIALLALNKKHEMYSKFIY